MEKSDSESDTQKDSVQIVRPVMRCHPAEGGETARLERGCTPSTPRGEKRRMSIKKFFRVTPEENRAIAFNAAVCGLEQSSYLRIQALGKSKVRKARRLRLDWDELRRCMGAVNRAGNVVNQYLMELRQRRGDGSMAQTALAEIAAACRAIVSALKEG